MDKLRSPLKPEIFSWTPVGVCPYSLHIIYLSTVHSCSQIKNRGKSFVSGKQSASCPKLLRFDTIIVQDATSVTKVSSLGRLFAREWYTPGLFDTEAMRHCRHWPSWPLTLEVSPEEEIIARSIPGLPLLYRIHIVGTPPTTASLWPWTVRPSL